MPVASERHIVGSVSHFLLAFTLQKLHAVSSIYNIRIEENTCFGCLGGDSFTTFVVFGANCVILKWITPLRAHDLLLFSLLSLSLQWMRRGNFIGQNSIFVCIHKQGTVFLCVWARTDCSATPVLSCRLRWFTKNKHIYQTTCSEIQRRINTFIKLNGI